MNGLTSHELAYLLLEQPDQPVVLMGPSSYGSEITELRTVTFKSVFDADVNSWVPREIVALDLFDQDADSPYSCCAADHENV